MPSGTVTLVVPLDAPLTVTDGGSGPTAYGSVLAGLSTAPAHIHHDGNQHGVQLALRPGAVRALFGVRAAEVAGGSYELADVMGPAADVVAGATARDRLVDNEIRAGGAGAARPRARRPGRATIRRRR